MVCAGLEGESERRAAATVSSERESSGGWSKEKCDVRCTMYGGLACVVTVVVLVLSNNTTQAAVCFVLTFVASPVVDLFAPNCRHPYGG